jgi:hypothetical protein
VRRCQNRMLSGDGLQLYRKASVSTLLSQMVVYFEVEHCDVTRKGRFLD